jgi:hypothetical protein
MGPRRCGTCYLEGHPGDKNCRRCGAQFEDRDLTWLMILAGVGSIGLISGVIGYFLK